MQGRLRHDRWTSLASTFRVKLDFEGKGLALRRREDPIGRATYIAITRLYVIYQDTVALIGHGRSPYRKSECSNSIRDTNQGRSAATATVVPCRGGQPISRCNACPCLSSISSVHIKAVTSASRNRAHKYGCSILADCSPDTL